MKVLCDRIDRLRVIADDPMVYHNLKFLGSLQHPQLTSIQEKILDAIENIYQI